MAQGEIDISGVEKDILKEIINIGVARAADSFAVIANEKVLLRVPQVEVIEIYQATKLADNLAGYKWVVQSDITGDIVGKTFMFLSADHQMHLIEICLKKSKEEVENAGDEMIESLFMEISNILTGSMVTQLANLLSLRLYGSPPNRPSHEISQTVKNVVYDFPLNKPLLFTIKTQFINKNTMVEFPMVIVFDMDTLEKILNIIRNRIKEKGNFFAT